MPAQYRGAALPRGDVPHPDLINLLRLFGDVTGRSLSEVCREATGDPKLLWDMNGGRKIGPHLKRKLIAYLEAEVAKIDDGLNAVEALIAAAKPPKLASRPSA